MKKCPKCKKLVSCAQWQYKDKLCRKCSYRKVHPHPRVLTEMSKEQLIQKIYQKNNHITQINVAKNKKIDQIKLFRRKLYRIRVQMDQILQHPYKW